MIIRCSQIANEHNFVDVTNMLFFKKGIFLNLMINKYEESQMALFPFDSLKFARALESYGFTCEQSEGLSRLLYDILINYKNLLEKK